MRAASASNSPSFLLNSKRKHPMRLFYSPAACSLAPHIVAREAGIPITLVKVDIATKVTETGEDLRSINPKSAIPTPVLDDGTVLTEGAVISQYLAGRGACQRQGSAGHQVRLARSASELLEISSGRGLRHRRCLRFHRPVLGPARRHRPRALARPSGLSRPHLRTPARPGRHGG